MCGMILQKRWRVQESTTYNHEDMNPRLRWRATKYHVKMTRPNWMSDFGGGRAATFLGPSGRGSSTFTLKLAGSMHHDIWVQDMLAPEPTDHNIGLFLGLHKSSTCRDESAAFECPPHIFQKPGFQRVQTSLSAPAPECPVALTVPFSSRFFPSLAEPALSGTNRAVPATQFGSRESSFVPMFRGLRM